MNGGPQGQDSDQNLQRTPLDGLHRELGAKMVPFAAYEMPVQFAAGILKEHLHTRAAAGLFDVSHMGQVALVGEGVAAALEALVPADLLDLGRGRTQYTQFTNEAGGILDDLMVTNAGDRLILIVNAACKAADIAHLRAGLGHGIELEVFEDRALLALQGPAAAAVLGRHADAAVGAAPFMSMLECKVAGAAAWVWRSGYTGEDGYEISIPADRAEAVATALLAEAEVEPIGLGARDSLRLEAGLCLYGHDIDETTTPVEAGLLWSVGKRRRETGGFPGAEVVQGQIADGPTRRRVGVQPEGRAPAREHTEITDQAGNKVGEITSGGFGPSVGGPVAMGYVETAHAVAGTALNAVVRGKPLAASVVRLPFVEHRYFRGKPAA